MTNLQLDPAELTGQIPELVGGAAVVALVPATELKGWAANMAWDVARAAARGGRRTALVDCFVDSPSLHGVVGAENDEGLVDAFEYGASFSRVAKPQPEPNLFFIPAGTWASDAAALLANPRWRRLAAGFRHEDALLLLYVAPEHLPAITAEVDGLVVLAPQGLDTAAGDVPAVMEAVGRGMPLLAVVADPEALAVRASRQSLELVMQPLRLVRAEETAGETGGAAAGRDGEEETAKEAAEAPAPAPAPPRRPAPRRPRGSKPFAMLTEQNQPLSAMPFLIVLLLAALGAGGWLYRDTLLPLVGVGPSRAARDSLAADSLARDSLRLAAQRDSIARADSVARAARVAVDSLPWIVQVASATTLTAALRAADRIEAGRVPAIVAPLRLANRRAVYRVLAGPWADSAAADVVLRRLRRTRILGPRAGSVSAQPLSVALGGGLTAAAARSERTRLRRAGVPVFALLEADSTFRLWAGAYASTTQAALLSDILNRTGAGELRPRVGALP